MKNILYTIILSFLLFSCSEKSERVHAGNLIAKLKTGETKSLQYAPDEDCIAAGGRVLDCTEKEPFTGKQVVGKNVYRYKNGVKHGCSTAFHKNGQKRWEGCYENGKKKGSHTKWDKKGNIEKTETY